MSEEKTELITDQLLSCDRIENLPEAQEDFLEFWAHCVDVMDFHKSRIEGDLPLVNKIMCMAYCAATWKDWIAKHCNRYALHHKKIEIECLNETIAELKGKLKSTNAKLARIKRQRKQKKEGGAK